MFLRPEIVRRAIDQLAHVHPFFGITFLVCKEGKLPVGSSQAFSINNAEEKFLLKYYMPNLNSKFYFQPFKTSGTGRWLSPRYPSTGSQKTRTAGLLSNAFIHKRATNLWGWRQNYVEILREKLEQDKTGRVPAFWLAVWLFRNRDLRSRTRAIDLVLTFLKEFSITDDEREGLLQTTIPDLPDAILTEDIFQEASVLKDFEPAPDAFPEEGGTLRELRLRNIGPVFEADFLPAERVSIITGDNGLGKTFLMECCWWSLTGQWAERQALPHEPKRRASIEFVIASKDDFPARKTIEFDPKTFRWPPTTKERPTIPGLIVYARVDGSFAVWDPARHYEAPGDSTPGFVLFSRDQVLDGLGNKIEGLIRDWVRWQNAKDQSLFGMFSQVLSRLSPPDMAPLQPGEAIRIASDSRDIPTLKHDYGVVPFINESAGVRRIVTVAYLLVWAWNEHQVHATLSGKAPQDHIVLMIDEIEAHLHPKWQRSILPALLDVTNLLSKRMKSQVIIATHSPMILASMENSFSEDNDKLFHLYLEEPSLKAVREVKLDEIRYFKHGTVDAWLTSDVFELKQPRSSEGESALEQAERLLAESSSDAKKITRVNQALKDALPADDPFWPRWLHFAEMKDVKL
jgi:hypothetical protein